MTTALVLQSGCSVSHHPALPTPRNAKGLTAGDDAAALPVKPARNVPHVVPLNNSLILFGPKADLPAKGARTFESPSLD